MSRNLGALTSWNPVGLLRPVMGQLFTLPSKRFHSLRVCHQNPVFSPMPPNCSSHLILLDVKNPITFRVQNIFGAIITQFSLASCSFLLLMSKYLILF
jgi:hypothetical protein